MTTLITGGGSVTGLALAELLHSSGRKVIFASRSGSRIPAHFPTIKLDWEDPSTFTNAFENPDNNIEHVYLLVPDNWDPLAIVKPFIDLAVEKGVKRFILLSAADPDTDIGPDSVGQGKVHTYLHEQGLDYVAVRPSWFNENFTRVFGEGIRERNAIETIVPTGRISFVAAQDIAQVAFNGIINPDQYPTRDPMILGPEILSYNDVAEIMSEVLRRPITHKVITDEEFLDRYVNGYGLPEEYARALIEIEKKIELGSQEGLPKDKRAVFGEISVRAWVEKNKDALTKSA